nr:hypothetical protein [Tanacetum cinerariifolium]
MLIPSLPTTHKATTPSSTPNTYITSPTTTAHRNASTTNTHHMVTRAKARISKPLAHEYNALISNGTWALVPRLANFNIVRTMWLFKHKFNANGTLSSLTSALQYLTFTRPNISYDVQQICLYMHDSRDLHFTTLKRILRYVRGTIDHKLHLHVSSTSQLIAYTDVDWGGCLLLVGLPPGIVCSLVITFCLGLPKDMSQCLILVLRQNIDVLRIDVYLSTNPIQHQRTKHIDIDIHFVREYVASGQVRVLHVPSRFQYANIFTKGLPTALFLEFRSSLNVRRPPAPTAEEY